MSQPSPDARAVVRAVEGLTTQVRRIADALTTPVAVIRDGVTTPLDDAPTTTCDASIVGVLDRPIGPCVLRHDHNGPVHRGPDGETWATVDHTPDDDTCRIMETRTCPPSHYGPCGERPCARFESDDPAPWLDTTEAPAADEDALRSARRDSLLVLLSRVRRGRVAITPDEGALLQQHVETEISEASAARDERKRLGLMVDEYSAGARHLSDLLRTEKGRADAAIERETVLEGELEAQQAAIERVRALRAPIAEALEQADYRRDMRRGDLADSIMPVILASLDGTEQPATKEPEPPAGNLAAYQAAIARVVLVLREAQAHREQTDPSERQDCVMCGADHFAEIRDAIKGKPPTTEA